MYIKHVKQLKKREADLQKKEAMNLNLLIKFLKSQLLGKVLQPLLQTINFKFSSKPIWKQIQKNLKQKNEINNFGALRWVDKTNSMNVEYGSGVHQRFSYTSGTFKVYSINVLKIYVTYFY